MWRTPFSSGATVAAASSRAFSAMRASPREAAFGGGHRPPQEDLDLLRREGVQAVDAAAREQGRDDLEGRVLGGGADESDHAVLDVGQDHVLLRLVEAMDLVDEEDGARAVNPPPPPPPA